MEHRIAFCRRGGTSIAYGVVGSGPPLVRVPGWVSHLEHFFDQPEFAFWEHIAREHTVFTYDKPGTGLSDRERSDFSLDSEVFHLEAVVDHLGLEQFDLFGASEGGPAAIVYAVRHPERVRRLVLYSTYAYGPGLSPQDFRESFVAMVRAHWGFGSKMLTDLLMPGASSEQAAAFAREQRQSASPEVAARFLEMVYANDVTEMLPLVRASTLVVQRRQDRAFPVRNAQMLAAGIPGARIELLDGNQHAAHLGDVDSLARVVLGFLAQANETEARGPAVGARGGFRTILFTDVVASTPLLSQLGDEKMREVMRAHDEVLSGAVRDHGGRVVKTIGDAFMAEFALPSGAVAAAIAAQQRLRERFMASEVPVRIRVGINAGEPIEEDGDLHGMAVVIAKRLESAADPGGILVSDVVRQAVAGKEFEFEDRGMVGLKGVDEPVRAWAVRWA